MKTLCDYAKKLPDNISLFVTQIENARYVCGKCGRPASEKDLLCKPTKIEKLKG
mgnify:CR=1 FL=1